MRIRIFIVFSVIILLSAITLGTSRALTPASLTPTERGERIFKKECQPCHGVGGNESMPGMKKNAADLSGEYVQKKSDSELALIIRKGKKGNPEMPGHPWLNKQQVADLISYLRTLKK